MFLTRNVDSIHGYYLLHTYNQLPDYKDVLQNASPVTSGLIPIPQLSFGLLNSFFTSPPFSHVECEIPEEPPTQHQLEEFEVFLWNWIEIKAKIVDLVVISIELILEITEINCIAPKKDDEKEKLRTETQSNIFHF